MANFLTIFRMLCVPLYIYFILTGDYVNAFFTFVVASFTDLIDGSVARLLHETSKWGAILDPIADKLLMVTLFVTLTITGYVPIWFTLILIVRDSIIMGGIAYLERMKIDVDYHPFVISKLTTLMLMITGGLGLIYLAFPEEVTAIPSQKTILDVSIYLTAFMLLLSGARYILKGREILVKRRLLRKFN